jgi:hypothetical protein
LLDELGLSCDYLSVSIAGGENVEEPQLRELIQSGQFGYRLFPRQRFPAFRPDASLSPANSSLSLWRRVTRFPYLFVRTNIHDGLRQLR